MAIKAALAAALLLALVALASATTFTFTTTVTTTTDDENSQQCSQQVQGRRFSKCEYFLKQRGSPYTNEAEEEDEDFAIAIANPQQGSLQACCQELRQMDRQHCGCEAIRHAARKAQQSTSTGYGSSQSQQIYQRARTLPRRCGLRQQQCRFSLVFV